MDPETLPLARDIYKLSQHPTQVWLGHHIQPYVAVSSVQSQQMSAGRHLFYVYIGLLIRNPILLILQRDTKTLSPVVLLCS